VGALPYFRLYVGDWIGDTLVLSDAERGAYFSILCAMWNAGGYLTMDQAKRASGTDRRLWHRRWARIAHYFDVSPDGYLSNRRLTQELRHAEKVSSAATHSVYHRKDRKPLKDKERPHTDDDKRARVQNQNQIEEGKLDMERKEGTQPIPTALLGEFTDQFGEKFAASWLSVASWTEHPKKTITPRTLTAFDYLRRSPAFLAACRARGIELLKPA